MSVRIYKDFKLKGYCYDDLDEKKLLVLLLKWREENRMGDWIFVRCMLKSEKMGFWIEKVC